MANKFLYELTDTWTSGVTSWNAFKMNVADAASAADSKLINFQINSVEKFTVDKSGKAYFAVALPVTSGGIGADTPSGGRTNLDVYSKAETQAEIDNRAGTAIATHAANTSNPHGVTKAQIGLGAADNTSDAGKPVSTAQQAALNLKANIASPSFTGGIDVATAYTGTFLAASANWSDNAGVRVDSGTGGTPLIAFHSPGGSAAFLGLDNADAELKFGGISKGNVAYKLFHEGNFDPALKANAANPSFTGKASFNGDVDVGVGQGSATIRFQDTDNTYGGAIHVNSNQLYLGRYDFSGWPIIANLTNLHVTFGSGITVGGAITSASHITLTNGNINCNGDITASRPASPSTGVIFLGNAGRYLFFDGTNYQLPTSGLIVGANITATGFGRADLWYDAYNQCVRDIRRVSQGVIGMGTTGDYGSPAGTVMTGLSLYSQGAYQPSAFFYQYIQGYSVSRGWFTMGG